MDSLTTVISPTTNATARPPLPANYHILVGVWLFVLVYIFAMAVATVVVNGLTLFAIYKDPLKCFRNPLAIFVTGVINADFLTGLIGEPIMAIGIAHSWHSEEMDVAFVIYKVGVVAACVTITVSFLILLALAISQVLAIGCPSRYDRCVSVFKAKLGIALIWIFTLMVSIGFAFAHILLVYGILVLEVGLTTIALVVLYLVPFCVFRSRVASDDSGGNEVVNKEFLKGTFLLVMIQIVTVWFFIAASIARATAGTRDNWVSLEIVRSITMVLFLAKFLLDPLILVWRIPKYRKSMKIVYASCLAHCGCAGGETATEAKVEYAETQHEDFDANSPQGNVDIEVK